MTSLSLSPSGGTGPESIYYALMSAGASAVQAAGIMGNMIAESSLNPESVNPSDSNGYASYGLCQWNAASYPSAASLVTGNPAQDIISQITFLANTGGFQAASGTTIAECASDFAANYERCSGCGYGGSANSARVLNAEQVGGWVASGNWPATPATATATAAVNTAEATAEDQEASTCLYGVTIPVLGTICVIGKSPACRIIGAGVMLGGALIIVFGLGVTVTMVGWKMLPAISAIAGPVAGVADALGATELASAARGTSQRAQSIRTGKPVRQTAAKRPAPAPAAPPGPPKPSVRKQPGKTSPGAA